MKAATFIALTTATILLFGGMAVATWEPEPSLRLEDATLNADAGSNWRCVVIDGKHYLGRIKEGESINLSPTPGSCYYIQRLRDEKVARKEKK